jgi:transposase
MEAMAAQKQTRYPDELRARAVRLVAEQREQTGKLHGAVSTVARQLGINRETLRLWVAAAEDDGRDPDDAERIRELEREVKELRRANKILRSATAYFAQAELDRQHK